MSGRSDGTESSRYQARTLFQHPPTSRDGEVSEDLEPGNGKMSSQRFLWLRIWAEAGVGESREGRHVTAERQACPRVAVEPRERSQSGP